MPKTMIEKNNLRVTIVIAEEEMEHFNNKPVWDRILNVKIANMRASIESAIENRVKE